MLVYSILADFFVFAVVASPAPRPFKRAPNLAVYDSCTKANDVALTFDDGPYIYLRQISDAFTNANAKATFFFNGNNYECIYDSDRMSDIKYAYNAGHMIGSHTWAHADLNSLSTAQIQDAMYRMEEAFSRILGVLPGFMRPPYGDYNTNVKNIAFARQQSLALWDWDTGDADGNTTAQSKGVYNQIVNTKQSNALVLQHETEESTVHTLVPYAINLFQSKGYNLVTLATCLGVQSYAAVGVPQKQSSSWTCNGTPGPGKGCGGSVACKTAYPPVFSTSTSTTTTSGPTATTKVIHPNGNTAKCLTAPTNANGGTVVISDCTNGSSQKWTISGSKIQAYGKCLDVTDGKQSNRNKMQIWDCTPATNANQQWTVSGSVSSNTIQWKGKSFCLDDTDGVVTNGNRVQIWTCTGGKNQKWAFASS